MAKNKKKVPVQLLSPENYIRQKARNLPIYECWINADWEVMRSAQIVVSRIHTNGNFTFAIYGVDLLCLGVRDTYYMFNASKDDYEDWLAPNEYIEKMKVDYSLIHNIIFAANDFATELGFKPHKDFTSITKYLLEEDTDEIELIEIECGSNGKPLFLKTKKTSDAEADRIIKQLEKAVGKGNFDVEFGLDADEKDIDDEMDFDDEVEAEFFVMDKTERRMLFLEMTKKGLDDLTDEEETRLMTLTDCIYIQDVCDEQIVDDLIDSWETEAEMEISDEEYTVESLGASPDIIITPEETDRFEELEVLLEKDPKKAAEFLNELRAKWGNIPFICYLELKYLQIEKSKEYKSKLEEYSALYPNYSLIKLSVYASSLLEQKDKNKILLLNFEDVFGDRSSITNFEMFDFQMKKLFGIISYKNLNELDAMYSAVDGLMLNEMYLGYLKTTILLTRFNLLKEYFNKNYRYRRLSLPIIYQYINVLARI